MVRMRRRLRTIQGLGGDAGATRHRLNAGRGIAASGELVARGLVNDLAGFIVAADLWATPAAPVFVGVDFSHTFV